MSRASSSAILAFICAVQAAMPAAAAAAAAGRRLGGGQALEVSLGRIVAALLICAVIALLAILLVRQRSGRTDLWALVGRFEMRRRAIQVVETRRLSPHADVCLIRESGREYLVLLLAGNATVLREGPAGDAHAGAEAAQ